MQVVAILQRRWLACGHVYLQKLLDCRLRVPIVGA